MADRIVGLEFLAQPLGQVFPNDPMPFDAVVSDALGRVICAVEELLVFLGMSPQKWRDVGHGKAAAFAQLDDSSIWV